MPSRCVGCDLEGGASMYVTKSIKIQKLKLPDWNSGVAKPGHKVTLPTINKIVD